MLCTQFSTSYYPQKIQVFLAIYILLSQNSLLTTWENFHPKFAMQRKVECNEMSRTLSKSIVLTVSGGPMEESRRKTPSFVHVALSFCLRDSTGVSGHHYCSPRQQCPQFSEFLTFVSFLYVLLSSFEARQNGIKSWLLSAIIIWRPISFFYTQKNKTK